MPRVRKFCLIKLWNCRLSLSRITERIRSGRAGTTETGKMVKKRRGGGESETVEGGATFAGRVYAISCSALCGLTYALARVRAIISLLIINSISFSPFFHPFSDIFPLCVSNVARVNLSFNNGHVQISWNQEPSRTSILEKFPRIFIILARVWRVITRGAKLKWKNVA